jgi:hypothetical protein
MHVAHKRSASFTCIVNMVSNLSLHASSKFLFFPIVTRIAPFYREIPLIPLLSYIEAFIYFEFASICNISHKIHAIGVRLINQVMLIEKLSSSLSPRARLDGGISKRSCVATVLSLALPDCLLRCMVEVTWKCGCPSIYTHTYYNLQYNTYYCETKPPII